MGLGGNDVGSPGPLGRHAGNSASEGLQAEGELGEHRPTQALAAAIAEFSPDRIVISTHPEVHSAWMRQDVVDKARATYPAIPERHIVSIVEAVGQT